MNRRGEYVASFAGVVLYLSRRRPIRRDAQPHDDTFNENRFGFLLIFLHDFRLCEGNDRENGQLFRDLVGEYLSE